MARFQIITFDVEHGNCHVLRTPSDQVIMIDAGSKADFSPSYHLYENWGVKNLRWLTVTHHDSDHLTDINYIDEYVTPITLERPTLTSDQLLQLYDEEFSGPLEAFLEFEKRYYLRVPPMGDPSYDWGGVKFATFSNEFGDLDNPKINDLSIVTFAHYMGWNFIFPGDLERSGWLKLMQVKEFNEWLGAVDIFIASHHGRDAGYCDEIFKICHPHLTIISDKSTTDTSVTDKYCAVSRGLTVHDKTGKQQLRQVLTTRSDGAINVEITEEGKYWISIQ